LGVGLIFSTLVLYLLLDHGQRAANLILLRRLVRHLPSFFMALSIFSSVSSVKSFLRLFSLFLLGQGLYDIYYNISFYYETGRSAFRVMDYQIKQGIGIAEFSVFFSTNSVHRAAENVYLIMLVAISSHFLLPNLQTIEKAWYAACISILCGVALFSGLTTPIFLMGMMPILFLFISRGRFALFATLWLLATLCLVIYGAYQFELSAFTYYFDKAYAAILSIIRPDEFDENARILLFARSISAFFSNPVFGVGGHAFIRGEKVLGGHSGIADTLAQFGLFGIAGIALILSFVFSQIKNRRSDITLAELHVTLSLFMVLFMSFIIHSFGNPTFGAEEINRVFLFSLGLYCSFDAHVRRLSYERGRLNTMAIYTGGHRA
jgi:hypothetical protein